MSAYSPLCETCVWSLCTGALDCMCVLQVSSPTCQTGNGVHPLQELPGSQLSLVVGVAREDGLAHLHLGQSVPASLCPLWGSIHAREVLVNQRHSTSKKVPVPFDLFLISRNARLKEVGKPVTYTWCVCVCVCYTDCPGCSPPLLSPGLLGLQPSLPNLLCGGDLTSDQLGPQWRACDITLTDRDKEAQPGC